MLRVKCWSAVVLAAFVLLFSVAAPAVAAVKLPARTAAVKAAIFAKHTCAHDVHCVKFGITNCRRGSLHVVFCRMYVERATSSQGRYDCLKMVRVALDPITYRILVTGTTGWSCH